MRCSLQSRSSNERRSSSEGTRACFLAVALFLLGAPLVQAALPSAQHNALVDLYNSTNGASWFNNTDWMVAADECTWYQVTCDAGHTTVQTIIFGRLGNNLSGTLPASLGNLTSLQSLWLSGNQGLSGSIPPELGSLTSLRILALSGNQLSGSIPSALTNLTNLTPGGSEFRYNKLYSTDPALTSFLSAKQDGGNWQSTQTIAPTDLSTSGATASTITVNWTPIAYTADSGFYQVMYSTTAGGPYTPFATTTSSKSSSSLTVTGLATNTRYYFVVSTTTLPHSYNSNTVTSGFSAEVSGLTAGQSLPPVVNAFTASPSTITAGQSSTLSWTTTNATSVSIGGVAGAQPANGSVSVSPAATTTYTLTATGPGGTATATATVTVSAAVPTVVSFGASPSTITAGESSTLSWTTTNATSVSISGLTGTQPASSSVSVSPTATTTYTLTATGPGGTATATTQVTVGTRCSVGPLPPPPLPEWESGVPPQSSLHSPSIDSRLDLGISTLLDTLLREGLNIGRESGYRPIEYQRHFRDLRVWFDNLVAEKRNSPAIETQCDAIIAELNREIDLHGIRRNESRDSLGGRSGAPMVNPPNVSNHTAFPALAIDLGVSRLSSSQLALVDRKAIDSGVYRPCGKADIVHFQMKGTPCDRPMAVRGTAHSPVAILLTAPDGRRIGFYPTRNMIVNDFGESGYYSGLQSEPQEVVVSGIADGVFTLSGIGTGFGPYRLDLDVYPSSTDGTDPADVVAHTTISGTTAPNEALKQLVAVAPKPEAPPTTPSRRRAVRHSGGK